MQIAPNIPRDYDEIIRKYQNNSQINIEELIKDVLPLSLVCENAKHKSMFLVLKSILSINIIEYEQLLKQIDIDERILFLYKLLIYDYFDYYQSCNTFCGVQMYSVARSLCNHSRIVLLCLCDSDFLEYYYSEYTEAEKKERYYKKRETNISKKLREIADEAKKLNTNESFYAESYIFNLTTELHSELTNKLGELSHLTEITLAKKFISTDASLNFNAPENQEFLKFNDNIIEYLILTTLATSLIFSAEGIKFTEDSIVLYNFLNALSHELYKFRNIDRCLIELKKQVEDILSSEDSEQDNI